MPDVRTTTKFLGSLVLLSSLALPPSTSAQQTDRTNPLQISSLTSPNRFNLTPVRPDLMPTGSPGYVFPRPRPVAGQFDQTLQSWSPNSIQRMEAAFSCNDTPFVDQVRLPLATFWRGRLKLVGFESDVTTANFVMGLPGQGALHSMGMFGNGFIAVHTPPSDQLAGLHLTFTWKGASQDANDNSGRRGIEFVVRASRGWLPFLGARSDSGAVSSQ